MYTVRVHSNRRTHALCRSRQAVEAENTAAIYGSTRIAWLAILFCLAGIVGQSQAQKAVCDTGNGQFETQFPTGVSVRAGAGHSGAFATRMCTAILSWNQDQLVTVANAPQVDIDVLGVDLGLGLPVVAFQVRKADHDWQSTYLIYSLHKKPRLLKTITGGDSYRAVDADFNKRVAIWTTDAAAMNGFDGLTYADYDSPPTLVLNFEHGKLTDVSAHYQPQYDRQIAALRAQLTAQDLSSFRKSDGRLVFGSVPPTEWPQLRKTKVKVLELRGPISTAAGQSRPGGVGYGMAACRRGAHQNEILAARARGIDSQVAAIAPAKLPPQWHDAPFVYKFLKPHAPGSKPETELDYGVPGLAAKMGPQPSDDPGASIDQMAADRAPVAILLWRPPLSPSQQALARSQETLQLVIDEAGKVHSAKLLVPKEDPELMNATKNWKFIPAFKDGRPVAYNLKLNVSPYQ